MTSIRQLNPSTDQFSSDVKTTTVAHDRLSFINSIEATVNLISTLLWIFVLVFFVMSIMKHIGFYIYMASNTNNSYILLLK